MIIFFVVGCYHQEDTVEAGYWMQKWNCSWRVTRLFRSCGCSQITLQMMDEVEFFWIHSSIIILSAMTSMNSIGHSFSRNFIKVEVWRQAGDHGREETTIQFYY
jgi:hypothetical protein